MASKRTAATGLPKMAISSPALQAPQATQQVKPRSPSPSPPPASITLKNLQDALAVNSQQLMTQMMKQTELLLDKKNEELCNNLEGILKTLSEHVEHTEERVEELEKKVDLIQGNVGKMGEDMETMQNDIVMSQYREMEFALRIRGLKENPKEDLREEVAKAVALLYQCDSDIIMEEIEKVYRVNSWVAHQRNLPRDVVVYFAKRTRRNEVIQAFYRQKFQIADQDIILLKEIPSRILRMRKDYSFLSQELKKRQIPFRWEIPSGMVVNYDGTRYRLSTTQKAKDFYLSTLKATPSPPQAAGRERQTNQMVMDPLDQPLEQRMTRAAHRWKEEREKEKALTENSSNSTATSEQMGGMRSKQFVKTDWQGLFQKLYKPKNG